MANQGAKRRVEENKKRLTTLQLVIVAANVWYIVLRMLIFSGSLFWFHYCALAVTTLIYFICYSWLKGAAAPRYSQGELVDGGSDLGMGGVLEYCHDFIYLSVIVQFLGVISDWFWCIFALVPLYGIYQCCAKVVVPYATAPSPESFMSDEYNEKLAKAERKRERRRTKIVRR